MKLSDKSIPNPRYNPGKADQKMYMAGSGTVLVGIIMGAIAAKLNLYEYLDTTPEVLIPAMTGVAYMGMVRIKNWLKHKSIKVP